MADIDAKPKNDTTTDDVASILKKTPSVGSNAGQGPTINALAPTKPLLAPSTPPTAPAKTEPAAEPTEPPNVEQLLIQQMKARDQERKDRLERQKEVDAQTAKYDEQISDIYKAQEGRAEKRELEREEIRKKMQAVKTELPPFKPPHTMNPVDQWGSAVMVFAMLASAFTRRPAITALNAASAALKGFQEGNKAVADQAFEEWKVANENLKKHIDFELAAYRDALGDLDSVEKLDQMKGTAQIREIEAKIRALNANFNNETRQALMDDRGMEGVMVDIMRAQTQQSNIDKGADQVKASEKVINIVNTGRYYDAETGTYKTDFNQLPDIKQLEILAGTGLKSAIDNYVAALKTGREQQQRIKEAVTKLMNSEDYKKASSIAKLEMRAELGDNDAIKELDKTYAKLAQTNRDGSKDSEDLENYIIMVANYAAPMPSMGRSGDENAQAYYRKVLNGAKKLNPAFQVEGFKNRQVAESHWADPNGYSQKQLESFNTLASHAAEMRELIQAMQSNDVPTFNRVKQSLVGIGLPDINIEAYDTVAHFVTDEMTKSTLGGAGAVYDRDTTNKKFDYKKPPEVLKNNLNEIVNIVGDRLAAFQQSYMYGTQGTPDDFAKMLTPYSRKLYAEKLGFDLTNEEKNQSPSILQTTPQASAPATPAASAAPAGKPANVPASATKTGRDNTGNFFYDPNSQTGYDADGKAFTWDKEGKRIYK